MGEIMIDYDELFRSGSDLKSFFKLYRKPVVVEHKAKCAQWFSCVLWDEVALKEFKVHEEMKGTLQTKMGLGRLLRNCIKDPLEGMAEQMKWKQPFILVDVISDKLEECGINKSLRVRETPTWNTATGGGSDGAHELKIWDLVIFPECRELAEEMILSEYDGVKKTVCIYNADVAPYPKPWIENGGEHVSGEIFLKTTRKVDEKILTVIIFHHGELENFKGVPMQNFKGAEKDKVVKLLSEKSHHYERMIAKLYPGSLSNDQDHVGEETVKESEIDSEKKGEEEELVPISLLKDIVGQFPVNNLEPLKDKLEKIRGERMATSTSSTSVASFDDEENSIAESLDLEAEQEALMIIDETDYELSDVDSDTMSVDVREEADNEIRKLAKYFLAFRK